MKYIIPFTNTAIDNLNIKPGNVINKGSYIKDELDKIKKEFAKTELSYEESKLFKKEQKYKKESYKLLSKIEKIL